MTSGEAGIQTLDPAVCGPRREAEERAGAALVGVTDVEFLRWPDGTVTGGIELRRAIAGVVRRHRPEMVLTMTYETVWGAGGSVNHADHRAVGLATIDAVRDAANRWVFPELGAMWSGVQATYAFGASNPTHFVDVSDSMDAAVESLGAHQAYLDGLGGSFDADEFLRGNASQARSRSRLQVCRHTPRVLNPDPDPGHRTSSHAVRLSDLAALDALAPTILTRLGDCPRTTPPNPSRRRPVTPVSAPLATALERHFWGNGLRPSPLCAGVADVRHSANP